MSVFNYEHRVSYYPVPKIACTSMKKLFFRLENGFEFRNFRANGKLKTIHSFFGSRPFEKSRQDDVEGHFRVAVVRDPVDRLVSCYRNRVVFHKDLSEQRLSPAAVAAGLVPNPSLSTFVRELDGYVQHTGSISHHAAPIVTYLGHDPKWFSAICNLQEIEQLITELQAIVGNEHPLVLPREQTGGPKLSRQDLTPSEITKIEHFYAKDYNIYGRFF